MGDRICILREGGKLAQHDTPETILASPADDFVAHFVGADRGLKRLALRRLEDVQLDPVPPTNGKAPPECGTGATLREALSLMLTDGSSGVVPGRRPDPGRHSGPRRRPQRAPLTRPGAAARARSGGPPSRTRRCPSHPAGRPAGRRFAGRRRGHVRGGDTQRRTSRSAARPAPGRTARRHTERAVERLSAAAIRRDGPGRGGRELPRDANSSRRPRDRWLGALGLTRSR
jgi:hypothetical protein